MLDPVDQRIGLHHARRLVREEAYPDGVTLDMDTGQHVMAGHLIAGDHRVQRPAEVLAAEPPGFPPVAGVDGGEVLVDYGPRACCDHGRWMRSRAKLNRGGR